MWAAIAPIFYSTPFALICVKVFFCILFSLTTYGTSLVTSGQLGPKSDLAVVPLPLHFDSLFPKKSKWRNALWQKSICGIITRFIIQTFLLRYQMKSRTLCWKQNVWRKTTFAAASITKPTIRWTLTTGSKRIFFLNPFPLARFTSVKLLPNNCTPQSLTCRTSKENEFMPITYSV
ncbi:hypothetical protein CKR_0222 [Clostridium kluyveri NBRC 12016]|uniref:Uncharacterized protein n=2 Tax=Clostridium TaxID=1485 RepID=A0A0E3M608_CLOSL|nr:hypothetical protein CSCA_1940 [Clostridium scatologenes]BAH05273.1 hypothetical protein CKR_0222 [Clostridium kluyveri NBRC 12016]